MERVFTFGSRQETMSEERVARSMLGSRGIHLGMLTQDSVYKRQSHTGYRANITGRPEELSLDIWGWRFGIGRNGNLH